MSIEKTPEYPLTSLYIYLSDSCNLNCKHCWITPDFDGKEREQGISPRYLEEAFRQSLPLGLARVKLTGGEPLIRKDILEVINLVREYSLCLDLETNATLLTGDIVSAIARNRLGIVSVSLDSNIPEKHDEFRGVKGAFSKTISGMELLAEHGIPFQVICSVYKENIPSIPELARLVVKKGATSLKLNPVTPSGRGADIYAEGANLNVADVLALKRDVCTNRPDKYGIPVYISLPMAFFRYDEIRKGNYGLCHILNILGILSDGTISFCGIGKMEKELVMGNIKNDRIEDVWRSSPVLKRMREEIPEKFSGVCGRCIFKCVCLGNCLASTFSETKTFTSGYPFCEEAFKEGLFPKTRLL